MHILITGGTGFIGRALVPRLLEAEHDVSVLTRDAERARACLGPEVKLVTQIELLEPSMSIDAVVNLAGAGIADWPWTRARKRILMASRVGLTQQLVAHLAQWPQPPLHFISASAVGYYGDTAGQVCDESASCGSGFAAELCQNWEASALTYAHQVADSQVTLLRLGVVLDKQGGLLQRLLPLYKLGLGSVFGSGQQWFPWIHRLDVVNIIQCFLEQPPSELVFNLVTPEPVSQQEFAWSISRQLRRPLWLKVPKWAMQGLLKEQSCLFFDNAKILPSALERLPYRFEYPQLDLILNH